MSTPEVTITLGHTGQVVKRKWADFAGARSHSYQQSIRERLGSNGGSSFSSGWKRQRGISVKGNLGHAGGENDVCLDRDDLRYELIRKRLPKKTKSHTANSSELRTELRGKLSGAATKSSMSSNVHRHDLQSAEDRHFLKIFSRETASDLPYMDPSRNQYSTLTRHDLRRRSPARPMKTYRSLCPPTYRSDMSKAPSIRSIDASGVRHVYNNPIADPSMSTAQTHMVTLTSAETSRPLTLLTGPSGLMPRNSYMAETPLTVAGLLNSLGLRKYAIHFQAEEVDMMALRQMGEKDLKDLGIPMGPRIKILLALSALSKRPLPRKL